ncbi:DEAD/DEAH box helicase [Sphaerisporangium sp. NPDC049002]|uniref:DEAD/DEAH box helicase n=1 Tax=Sphaerisporangium sp. NPDC049002 TaxID=3155392 RepID=UPI0033C9D140
MKPTLAAEELQRNLTQFLTTTFALAEKPVREALERFLTHPEQGIFRGPYLRIRTPFRAAEEGWRDALGWAPQDFMPYRHQARAFQRLSSLNKAPQPTLITTGTGSGKTESFLLPVLDHCRRERAEQRPGVKAVLLYPMNALATDQAHRMNEYLRQPDLQRVTAALYIGDTPEVGYQRVMTQRAEIRRNPPDILITNYKMLDLLLQRADDLPLWDDACIAYVVVDEFHTYDGAQGTDVAMLLRRLAAATGHSTVSGQGEGRPLGAERAMVSEVENRLGKAGIIAASIGPEGPKLYDAVHIGTMHRFKGLEYQRMIIAGVAEGLVPSHRVAQYERGDALRYRRELQRARSLLFVACTRARDSLVISWNGRRSRFLP